MTSSQFYPGQQIVASDGVNYTLTHYCEGTWWAARSGAALPVPVSVRYPAWGGDDDRSGADQARRRRLRNAARTGKELRRGAERARRAVRAGH